jgi:2-iminobutanoate/2-iminopropanoate deaminase
VNGLVFVSGQLALKPGDKELSGGDIGAQTEQVFANLRAILEEAGSSLDNLVKTTVFLQNLDDFAGMNEVYSRHVGDTPPARSTVEVAKLPSGALVEIEAVALV